jgi:hypothetical protein
VKSEKGKVQDDIYKDMSLDEIFKQASDTWQKNKSKTRVIGSVIRI